MPVQIGRKESDFHNPLGLLSDCHRRIERFLRVLVHVAQSRRGAAMPQDEAESFRKALDYFKGAAPKHTRDEEDSLFPRMRATESEEMQAALAEMERLETEHAGADAPHAEVDTLGRTWLERGTLPEGDARRLLDMLERLTATYHRHIAVEDSRLFPLAGKVLRPDEIAAIGAEMAARRR